MTNEQIFYLVMYMSGLIFFYFFWYDLSFQVSALFLKMVNRYDYEIELIDNIKETLILWYDFNIQELFYTCGLFIVPAFIFNNMIPLLVQCINIYYLKFILGTTVLNNFVSAPGINYEFMCSILNSFPFQDAAVIECETFIRVNRVIFDSGLDIFIRVMPHYRVAYLEYFLGLEDLDYLDIVRQISSRWGIFFDPNLAYEKIIEYYLVEYALLNVDVNHSVSIYEMVLRWDFLKLYISNNLNFDMVIFSYDSVHSLETYKNFIKFIFRYVYGIKI